jgi:uncharacterized protein (TIRG00374 family)
VLLARADVRALASAIAHAKAGDVALAFAVLLVGLVVNAFRWQLFLRPLGLELPVSALVRLTFVGTFFNAFLPTGFGGDAYKSFRLRGQAASMAPPLATVVLDRLAGLAGLALLGLVGAVVRLGAGDRGKVTVAAAMLALAVLSASALALWSAPRWSSKREGTSRVAARFRIFVQAFATAGREPQAVRSGTVVGLVSAILLVVVNALLAKSLGISLPAAVLPGIVLIALLTTVLPLSINGLGFREAAYVWCLGAYGIGDNRALAFALLVLAVTLASSAFGGIVYAVAGGEVRARR